MSVTLEKSLILDASQVHQKIKRIAYEILENNVKEKLLTLAGIDGQGFVLAGLLQKELQMISSIDTRLVRIYINKMAPKAEEVSIEGEGKDIARKSVILIDDVLNTGKTLAFAMLPFFKAEPRKIEVAVLVNRSHPLFPIMPTYTGLELSTTLNEHVEVFLGKKSSVYLR
jgi:pyrimidine operon attenuation protein/uracil phosphoribosyltransferase